MYVCFPVCSALINYLRFKHFVIGAVDYEHFVDGQVQTELVGLGPQHAAGDT